jgi:hypothetical protein
MRLPRAVDAAMDDDRPEKQAIRELWVEEVVAADAAYSGNKPLYTTLAGAGGRELELLADRGVIALTETGAIDPRHLRKVFAIEAGRDAIAELQRRFPGLKIVGDSLQNVLKATTPLRWPEGDSLQACQARLLNLDLNTSLECQIQNNQLIFPVVEVIRKIATIQAQDPASWRLFLTLDARINWTASGTTRIKRFLKANLGAEPAFSEATRAFVGQELFDALGNDAALAVDQLTSEHCQKVLMTLVPKAIARAVGQLGWKVITTRNLRYGGTHGRAAMVSWIVRFEWDDRASTEPELVYRESLRLVHDNVSRIDAAGAVVSS